MTRPRYPKVEVRLASGHPLAWIAATRHALRRAGVARSLIHEFTAQAFDSTDPHSVCRQWVRLIVLRQGFPARRAPRRV